MIEGIKSFCAELQVEALAQGKGLIRPQVKLLPTTPAESIAMAHSSRKWARKSVRAIAKISNSEDGITIGLRRR